MRPRLMLLSVLASIPFALLILSSPAAAGGPPFIANGNFQESFIPSNIRTEGRVTLFDITGTENLSGTFSGTAALQGSCVVPPSGQAECQATENFTGTVAGRGGTVTWHATASVDLNTGSISGTFVILTGTGDLANLQGQGTFEGVAGIGTYTGKFVFAP